jgi:hypothetical protein
LHAEISQFGAKAQMARGAFLGLFRLGWRDRVQVSDFCGYLY